MARVLVVEDNEVNLTLMQYLLQAFGHDVIVARDGEEGLVRLRETRPDVVVCDIEMPRMDGVAFAAAVRADGSVAGIPLLAVTSSAMVGDRDRFMSAGFDDYAAKPIDPQRFVPWLEGHLQSRGGAAPVAPNTFATLAEPPMPAPAADAPLVLVLDDEPVNLSLKRSMLEPLGYRVVTTDNADDAIAIALAEPPQLILSDVGMPEADGFEFICRVLQQPSLRGIPFIFVTASHWNDSARDKALALGAWRFLQRPLPTEQLLAEIRSALAARR